MLKVLVTSLVTLISFRLCGQFNDTTRFFLGYSCTGNYNRTKTNTGFLINNSLDLRQKSQNSVYNLTLKQLFGRQQRNLVNDDFTAVFNINKPVLIPRLYLWGLASYGRIYSLKVNSQVQSGAGLTYYLIDRDWMKFNLSDGILYDYSDLQQNDSVRDIYGTFRNSFRLQVRLYFRKTLTFQSSHYIQNSLRHKGDIILKNESEIIFHLIGIVHGNVKLIYNKMTRTDRETLLVTWGLSLNKYF